MDLESIVFNKICNLNEEFELQYNTEVNKVKKILIILCDIQNIKKELVHDMLIKYYEIFPNQDINNENLNDIVNNFTPLSINNLFNNIITNNVQENLILNNEEDMILQEDTINNEQEMIQPANTINNEQEMIQPANTINNEQEMIQPANTINNEQEMIQPANTISPIVNILENFVNSVQNNTNTNIHISFHSNIPELNQNNNQEDVPIVIKKEIFDKLPIYNYNELDENIKLNNKNCPITMDNFLDDDKIVKLPCNHIFKYDSIHEWLINNSHKCPVCRISAGESEPKI